MFDTKERITNGVKHHATQIVSVASIAAAASVVAYYKHKYGGDIIFSVSADTMNALHREGTAVLQDLGQGRYTLATLPF